MYTPARNDVSADAGAIAFVQAGWHREIVEQGRLSFESRMRKSGEYDLPVERFEVPGSLELPLQCQLLAKTGRFRLIVAAGFIVDGKIYRHEFVASTVLDALMRVQLDTGVPVLSMVLTPHAYTPVHRNFFLDHFKVKGEELAAACITTLENLEMAAQLS